MFHVKRSPHNPILAPVLENTWENSAVFNCCPIIKDGRTELVYRAISEKKNVGGHDLQLSVIGHATSENGIDFENRREFILPEMEWEEFGCEDPRVTKIEDKYYIFYTALSGYPFSAENIKVAVAISSDLEKIDEKHLVTPFNAKAMSLFPEKVNGKFTAVLTVNTDTPPSKICIVQFDEESDMWSEEYWKKFYGEMDNYRITLTRGESDHVEIGAPPIKTKDGWLFIYSHIQNYFSEDKIFGVEAFLTDLENPGKIIKKTSEAFLIPEANYELYGQVDNIIFPSGTLIEDDTLKIFYGAADTTCALAEVRLDALLDAMDKERTANIVKRYEKNPIMVPDLETKWRSKAIFNPAAIDLEGKIHILYRAMSDDNTSYIGYAATENGFDIIENSPEPAYWPRMPFENKGIPNGNSGCEDPRIVQVGDKIYLFYTAYNGIDSPKVAISSIPVGDFLEKKWNNWTEPIIVSPEKEWDKDACIIPEKIRDKYFMIHRLNSSICADYMNSLDFSGERVQEYIKLMSPREGMWDSFRIGLSTPPIKTEKGWLLFYHGVNDGVYKLGAALLDLENPEIVLARTSYHIMEPEMDYELRGQVNRVVFPCGTVQRDGVIFIYYGGADSVLCVATIKMEDVLRMLE